MKHSGNDENNEEGMEIESKTRGSTHRSAVLSRPAVSKPSALGTNGWTSALPVDELSVGTGAEVNNAD